MIAIPTFRTWMLLLHVVTSVHSHSLAICVLSDSQDFSPYESTAAFMGLGDRSCVLFATKNSFGNTIGDGIAGYIPERESSFAAGICSMVALGVAVPGLLVEMLWVGTSDQTKGGSVSDRSWTKRKPKGVKHCSKNMSRPLPRLCSEIQLLLLLIWI